MVAFCPVSMENSKRLIWPWKTIHMTKIMTINASDRSLLSYIQDVTIHVDLSVQQKFRLSHIFRSLIAPNNDEKVSATLGYWKYTVRLLLKSARSLMGQGFSFSRNT